MTSIPIRQLKPFKGRPRHRGDPVVELKAQERDISAIDCHKDWPYNGFYGFQIFKIPRAPLDSCHGFYGDYSNASRMNKPSNIIKLKQLFLNIITSNLPSDTDLEVLRKFYLMNLIGILGTIFLTVLGSITFFQRDYLLCTADFLVLSFLLYLFFYLRRTNNYLSVGRIGTVVVGLFYFFLVAHGGANNTTYMWVFTYPLISLFLLGSWLGSLSSFLLFGLMCIVFAIGDKVAYFTSYKADLILRLTLSYITVTLFALVMERVRHITQNRLRISNTKLEEAVKSLEQAHSEKDCLILELQQTINEVKTLQGIIPICASCKKIRDDSGYWQQVEEYVRSHSDAEFSHSICPECAKKLYPGLNVYKD